MWAEIMSFLTKIKQGVYLPPFNFNFSGTGVLRCYLDQ